jgi:hypothetical protein
MEMKEVKGNQSGRGEECEGSQSGRGEGESR